MARLDISEAGRKLMIETIGGRRTPRIKVESGTFADGRLIPDEHSDYGDGMSPELRWSEVPEGTRAVALVAEDPDASRHTPFTHWLLYNLPADIRELPAAIPPDDRLPQFKGAAQGRASNGTIGYFGPHPPKDDGPHHYHFEVFCLDSPLDLRPGATRSELMQAMAGHVLAKGEVVGLYEAPVGSDR
jgi:Raf kinase inhibitor-like YbhB/YbcL family protein